MKIIKSLKLSFLAVLLFTFLGCCDDCKIKLEKSEKNLHDKIIELQKSKNKNLECAVRLEQCQKNISSKISTILINPYIPIQNTIKMSNSEKIEYKNKHFIFNDISDFDTSKNEINIKFPISNERLTVVDVVNVSSKDLNAIVVLVNGVQGAETRNSSVSHFMETKIEIDKVKGLSSSMMKSHKELKVFVFHDDAFYSDKLRASFQSCILNDGVDYKPSLCLLPDPINNIDFKKPREQEGDIILGD